MEIRSVTAVLATLIVASGLLQPNALAQDVYSFVPTQAEWMAWPEFCRVKYVDNPSVSRNLAASVTSDMRERAKALLGTCYGSAHHYCYAIDRKARALAMGGKERAFGLHQAAADFIYVTENCPKDNPFWSDNQTQLALVQYIAGNASKSLATLDEATKAHPDFAGAYVARAIILSRSGQNQQARDALLAGEKASGGESADLQYALGLSYYRGGDYSAAREHARKAYGLGYPLPWLKDNLAKVGYPL